MVWAAISIESRINLYVLPRGAITTKMYIAAYVVLQPNCVGAIFHLMHDKARPLIAGYLHLELYTKCENIPGTMGNHSSGEYSGIIKKHTGKNKRCHQTWEGKYLVSYFVIMRCLIRLHLIL